MVGIVTIIRTVFLFKTQLSLSKTFQSENIFWVYKINIPEN